MKRSVCIVFLATLFITLSALAANTPQQIHAAIQEACRHDTVYQNALYMYLRIAGIFWIAVEWIAAIILWRACRLLRNAAKAKGFLP